MRIPPRFILIHDIYVSAENNEMTIQLTLLLAYANVGFWIWMMSALTARYGFPSDIEHVPMIGFAFSAWLALRVRRAENKDLELKEREEN